jgi:hypothetical protein
MDPRLRGDDAVKQVASFPPKSHPVKAVIFLFFESKR